MWVSSAAAHKHIKMSSRCTPSEGETMGIVTGADKPGCPEAGLASDRPDPEDVGLRCCCARTRSNYVAIRLRSVL